VINFLCQLMTRVSHKQAPLIVTGQINELTGVPGPAYSPNEVVSSPGTLGVQMHIYSISRNRHLQLL